jgi:pimeloyl-ACP methyl ester carboxylesterase
MAGIHETSGEDGLRPGAVREEEVTFRNGRVTLAGSLLTPSTGGPHPAAVLVHGSGPQDRNGDLGLLRFHAEHFARHGIASLIYDKRGVGASTGEDWNAWFEDLARDALAGIRLLSERADVAREHVGLWGISQAGWILPMAASMSQDVAFLILVSPPAVTIAQQNEQNAERTLRAQGLDEHEIATAVAHVRLFNQVLRTGQGWEELRRSADTGEREAWSAFAWRIESPPSPEQARALARELDRDPASVLAKVTCPVLALWGEIDTVVSPLTDKPLMEQALRAAGHTSYVAHVFRNVHHEIVSADVWARRAAAHATVQAEDFAPGYLAMMVGWIGGVTGADARKVT